MKIDNRAGLPSETFRVLREQFETQSSLQDLLRWAQQQPAETLIPGIIVELIVQDEFTHDLVIPWRDLFLVYGTT